MKIDLHVHSKFSKRPSEWILKKIGCPESFTEPSDVYKIAKRRGMSMVTITDHNTIDGCLEIAHKPDVFISEEVTTYNPEDGCKFHVLVYDIDEKIHSDIQKARSNIFELVQYIREKEIVHSLAHPLYSVNGKLNLEHMERCLVMFKNFEQNGARESIQNQRLRIIVNSLNWEKMHEWASHHGLEKFVTNDLAKNFTGGSDDHSSLTIARCYTRVDGAVFKNDFFHGLTIGRAKVFGQSSKPETLAQNIYSIGYQFYGRKFGLSKYVKHEPLFRFLDKFLLERIEREPRILERFNLYWRSRFGGGDHTENGKVIQLLRQEAHRLMKDDPCLFQNISSVTKNPQEPEAKWFKFLNSVSNKLLKNLATHIIDSIASADLFNIFQSLGSTGALYSLLAPYFVSYSIFSQDRQLSLKALEHFQQNSITKDVSHKKLRVVHFTDTFFEINGVTGTLRNQIDEARTKNRHYTVITCDRVGTESNEWIKTFVSIGAYELEVYPEQKLFFPPFLEILSYCYEREFNQIHAATPGPLGLAALAISKILKIPIIGTYHTALPQYAQHLTDDNSMAEMVWRYVIWFYDQMEAVFVPSKATLKELVDHGISESKIFMMPRGVDSQKFHPGNRSEEFLEREFSIPKGLKLLYVGRVSKEKNLALLENTFKSVLESGIHAQLLIVGDGPYLSEMRQNLRNYPAYFTGYLNGQKLLKTFASCDLFVFPSLTDTFGNVVLEAQASGLPVIVTDQGGPCENMIDGQTGLVAKGSNQETLSNCILRLIADSETLKKMGFAAREYAEKRSLENALDKIWQLYAQINSSNPQSSNRGFFETYGTKNAACF
ncbi:MAG: glycosyltransferase [Syntrophaceae bacterium]|nr:glycosyltransferase [Syntrophaceae bacterium]